MKKLISTLLAVSLLFILTACSATKDNNNGIMDDIKDGAQDMINKTEDMADDMMEDAKDFADDMLNGSDNPTSEMPDSSVDGSMANTETNINPDTAQ